MRNSQKLLTLLDGQGVPWYLEGSGLAASLVAYWPLDEASGNRIDELGGITLTDTNTVTSATGITHALAAELVIANSECLITADSATLSQVDWGAVWFKPTTVAVSAAVVSKFHTTGNREWLLAQVNANLVLQVSPDGSATANGSVTLTGALEAGEWHLAVWYHDAANDLLGLSINGQAFATAAYSGGMFNSLASFDVGRQSSGGAFFGGLVQDVLLGKGTIPSNADAAEIYHRGHPSGLRRLRMIGYGGEVSWSPDGARLAYDRRDANGVYQIYLSTPNGGDEICLTDVAVSGGPAVDRNKGWPYFHPSADYLVLQVEQDDSPAQGSPDLTEPGRGWWNNVWMCTLDGATWWQLTDYAVGDANGVLNPRISPDGTKLLWAKKIGAVDAETAPLGVWNLQIADLAITEGTPAISNITSLTPGSKSFYESHGFNRDSDRILYTSDPDTGNLHGYDIFTADLDGTNITNLTASDASWDEHAAMARHADMIAWMSSRTYPSYSATGTAGLIAETYVMREGGTAKRQITRFNTPGFPEYEEEDSVATSCAWSPDGSALAICRMSLGDNYDTTEGRRLYIAEFNGPYA